MRLLRRENVRGPLVLTAELVRELCGGSFPDSGKSKHWRSGFAWERCEYRLEDGLLVPYDGDNPAPGPDLRLVIAE